MYNPSTIFLSDISPTNLLTPQQKKEKMTSISTLFVLFLLCGFKHFVEIFPHMYRADALFEQLIILDINGSTPLGGWRITDGELEYDRL